MNKGKTVGLLLAGAGVMLLGLRSSVSVIHRSYIDPGTDPLAVDLMKTLRNRHEVTGSYWMGRVKGNGYTDREHNHGARSAFIYIPRHFNPNQPYELIFFFHGLTGYFKNTGGNYGHRVTMAMKEMDDSGRNYILVFPEMVWSHFTSAPRGRQRVTYDGSEQENFPTFYAEVIRIIDQHFGLKVKPYRTVMIGHSAGGSTLRAISTAGMMDAIKPELVIWSDSAYGSWLNEFHRNFKNQSNTKVVLFNVVTPNPKYPWAKTNAFINSIGGKPSNYQIVPLKFSEGWSHKAIGDQILQIAADY